MTDITDVYSVVSKTKQTIGKTLSSLASTLSTTFVDVTGSSITVPNNWYYAFICDVSVNTGTTGTWKLLEGAIQKDTANFTGNASAILFDQQKIYQNTSGSSQTVKMQVKTDGNGVSPQVGMNNLSIITSPNPIIYISTGAPTITIQNKCYLTSMDVLVGFDTAGTGLVSFFENQLLVHNNDTTPKTLPNINKLIDSFTFNVLNSPCYLVYDWDGKQIVI